jgi:hypothetical protein
MADLYFGGSVKTPAPGNDTPTQDAVPSRP